MLRLATVLVFSSAALLGFDARAAPGEMFVSQPTSDWVLEFSAGGDLSRSPRFATGLQAPGGLCVGPGGEIYVGEFSAGEVTIITSGGDFTPVPPFAFGLNGIIQLWCDDNTIFVADQLSVFEVSAGGDFSAASPFATGLDFPTGVTRGPQGTLWAAAFLGEQIFDITAGGDFSAAVPFATGQPFLMLETFDGMLLSTNFTTGVFDVTAGGDFSGAAPFATLPQPTIGLLDGGPAGLFALSGSSIYEISAGGDFTAAAPFATGLAPPMGATFSGMVRHVCSRDADCDDDDACNGVESCANNECLPGVAPDCDDTDVCTADSCHPAIGCMSDPIFDCCEADTDCRAGEVCDVVPNLCTPAGGTTGDGGTTTNTGPAPTTTGDETGGDDAGTAGAAGDDDGCSCRAEVPPRGLAWLGLLPLVRRRRR